MAFSAVSAWDLLAAVQKVADHGGVSFTSLACVNGLAIFTVAHQVLTVVSAMKLRVSESLLAARAFLGFLALFRTAFCSPFVSAARDLLLLFRG